MQIKVSGYLLSATLLALASFVLVTTANAHRMPGSLSTIKTNSTTGAIEIIHRLHSHDAEQAMITFLKDRTISIDQLAGQAHLALYIEERFIVANSSPDGVDAPLEIELIGAELDGEFVLVYQEFRSELPLDIAVRNDILRDVFPGQINQVNIAVGGEVRSLTFEGEDEWHSTRLD